MDAPCKYCVGFCGQRRVVTAGGTCRPPLRWGEDSQCTWDLTNGGAGRRYPGSSGDLGSDVEMSIKVVASANVREIVIASLGLLKT